MPDRSGLGRLMCEQFVARSATPFAIRELWDFTERLERFGIASYGWGAAWLADDGHLRSHRDLRAFREDPGRESVGRHETTVLLVHLRRPSALSTIGLADTQPFEDPAGRFAFSHNGDLERHQSWRPRYREQGRLQGRADSEIAERWLEDEWPDTGRDAPDQVPELLRSLHVTFGGEANLAVLTANGEAFHYAGNRDNPLFSFRLGELRIVATSLHSFDRSLFRLVAPAATGQRLVPNGTTVSLDDEGAEAPGAARARHSRASVTTA